jgi:NADH:ubiquinone oxidoreductase subunit 5 (subunit L)/multisubunit Na+/H+ antiporter MnhA subunit
MFLGLGTNFWNVSIFNLSDNIIVLNGEFMPFYIKLLPLYFSFFGSFFVIFNNYILRQYNYFNVSLKFKNVYIFLIKKWYFDVVYNKFIIFNTLNLGFFTFKDIDRGIIEIAGPLGIVRLMNKLINKISKIDTGYIYHFIFLFVIGIFFMISYISFFDYIYIYDFDVRFYLIFILFVIFLSNKYSNLK